MKTWWQKEETRTDLVVELIVTDKEDKDFHFLNKNTSNNERDTMSKDNNAFDKGFEKYNNPLMELLLLKYLIFEVYL